MNRQFTVEQVPTQVAGSDVSKSKRRPYQSLHYDDLPPSTLHLHGLTYAQAGGQRSTVVGREASARFRGFIEELVPMVDSEHFAGRVALRLLRYAQDGNYLSNHLFKATDQDTIEFTGTRDSGITHYGAILLAGRQRTGAATLELFAALSDEELTATAFANHNYSLVTSSDLARCRASADQLSADQA